ncbi:MAG TPA: hypothetical protein VF211_06645 [Burkholderiales bacterium]
MGIRGATRGRTISFAPDARERELLEEFEAEHHKRPRLNWRA